MQKSTMIKKEAAMKDRKWYIIDATNAVLGKLAVQVANLLRGKNKPTMTLNVDCGDYVIVYNTDKIILTGNKLEDEFWYSHSQYIGGLRKRDGKTMLNKYSDELLELAVKGMLPKNRLSRRIITKLHIYKKEVTKNYEAHHPIKVQAEGVRK
ncbi:MAG: 50S ribosomal protein L13 [Mycoplasma sp.]|nr:50S ribosomal protein L13 [Mycoplasma sp.]